MKTCLAFLLPPVFALTGCERRPAPAAADLPKPEIEWNEALYSIEDYKRMQPHRPILAIFTHRWDLPIVNLFLKKKEFMDILRENTFLCLRYESTAPDSIGQVEMKKVAHESYPQAFVSIPNLGDSVHSPGYSEEEWLAFVIKISRDAELAGRSGGDKPPKWSGGPPAGWTALEAPLEDHVARNPGKPIIVAFGAEWVIHTQMNWRSLVIDGVTESLQRAGFVCISADLTQENPLARDELKRLHYDTVPVTAIYNPTTRKWEVDQTVLAAENMHEWVETLRQRIAESGPRD